MDQFLIQLQPKLKWIEWGNENSQAMTGSSKYYKFRAVLGFQGFLLNSSWQCFFHQPIFE